MRGSGDGDKAQLFDAAFELLDGFLKLLHDDQRHAFQTLRIGLAIAVEPNVIDMGDGTGEIVVFEKRQAKKHSGAEVNHNVDIFEIHVFDTLNRIEHTH